jgi:hypothetical protein
VTREEHLAWAKQRAHEELDRGSITNAVASMLSDLGKHEDLEKSVRVGVMIALTVRDRESCQRWIDGFN